MEGDMDHLPPLQHPRFSKSFQRSQRHLLVRQIQTQSGEPRPPLEVTANLALLADAYEPLRQQQPLRLHRGAGWGFPCC
jgi:hypothetical protein